MQITYTDLDGAQALRLITKTKPVTRDRAVAEKGKLKTRRIYFDIPCIFFTTISSHWREVFDALLFWAQFKLFMNYLIPDTILDNKYILHAPPPLVYSYPNENSINYLFVLELNLGVLGVHTAQKSAALAMKGQYTQSRLNSHMQQRLVSRWT